MKNQIFKTLILSCFFFTGYGQIKVINNGYVAIGINWPNYPFHAYGWAQLFNYNNGEIKFRANNGQQSDIGSNFDLINFWNANNWQHSGWNRIRSFQHITVSDERLKENISDLSDFRSIINQLNPKKYNMKDSIPNEQSDRFYYGFLAQEVMSVLPDLVDTSRGVYGMDYNGLIPFLVGAVKEQSIIIDSLRSASSTSTSARGANPQAYEDQLLQQIQDLKTQINDIRNNCCQKQSQPENNSQKADNSGINIVANSDFLLQNIPNPFDNSTTIKYKIPNSYSGKFFIKIFDLKGEEKISYEISQQDQQIVISPSALVSGMYLYSLIVNNDILATKQMIISR